MTNTQSQSPSGDGATLPVFAIVAIVVGAVVLVAVHTWISLALGLAVLLAGLAAVAAYTHRVSAQGRRRAGATEAEGPSTLSPHDVPLENPAREAVAERRRRAVSARAR
ncbi:MAG TPA: hypothetical protein VHX88_14145 [Solirubrobacteraceae bacterium]|jgi:hypothetical protein|nr:hypothetical protein [Solirubrobacteraceae bacterium]